LDAGIGSSVLSAARLIFEALVGVKFKLKIDPAIDAVNAPNLPALVLMADSNKK